MGEIDLSTDVIGPELSLQGSVALEGRVRAELNTLLYGVAGPSAHVEPYVRFQAVASHSDVTSLERQLVAGVRGKAGGSRTLFGIPGLTANMHADLFDSSHVLWSDRVATCVPNCDGRSCGGDGCGGSCGECSGACDTRGSCWDCAESERCGDGLDDDCDGLVDCDDADCANDAACYVPPSCDLVDLGSDWGMALWTGTTATQERSGSCGGEGPEVMFAWTAPAAGVWVFDTEGSRADTVLYVRQASCEGPEMACNDDTPDATGLHSAVEVELELGQTIYVVVDTYVVGGDVVLNIF